MAAVVLSLGLKIEVHCRNQHYKAKLALCKLLLSYQGSFETVIRK